MLSNKVSDIIKQCTDKVVTDILNDILAFGGANYHSYNVFFDVLLT